MDFKNSKLYIFKEIWQFMKIRKKWWLLPIFVVLILLGIIIVFAEGSAFAPFMHKFRNILDSLDI